MGAILGGLAGGLATAGGSILGSKLFGGSTNVSSPLPSINAGGLTGKGGTITASPERQGLVGNIAATFPQQASAIGDLLSQVGPGFGRLTDAAVTSVRNARSAAIGNLKDTLQRRRVLGSSFGQDALTRAETEFANQENATRANSFLQELQLTNQLMQQQFEAQRGEFQTGLDELNLEANAGVQLSSQATAQLGQNARTAAYLDAAAQAGAGKFFGQAFQPVGTAVNSAVTNWYNGATTPSVTPSSLAAMVPTNI